MVLHLALHIDAAMWFLREVVLMKKNEYSYGTGMAGYSKRV